MGLIKCVFAIVFLYDIADVPVANATVIAATIATAVNFVADIAAVEIRNIASQVY